MMRSHFQLSALLLLSVATPSAIVLAHGGHGNEFGGSQAVQAVGSVQVDEATAKRMGLKLETISRKSLAFGIKTTGQIENLPNQKVAVTTPVTGTVTQLLMNPGDVVEAGQPVAVMATPELAELRTTELTAPIAGTVADRETTQGESGQDAGKKVMTIVNNSSVQVSGNLYEKDLSRIKAGQKVRVKVGDRSFEGRISVTSPTVQGDRTVPVKAELGNAGGALKPGMFVELEVLTDQSAAVVAIPKAAIVETNDKKKIVFVQNGAAFQPAEVELGQESGDAVEVKSGLFEGDKIVTQRANQLYAQSLRSAAPDDHDKLPVAAPVTTNSQNPTLDWWMISVGIAIASSTFWAGTAWAKRQIKPQFTVNASEFSGNNSATALAVIALVMALESTSRLFQPQTIHFNEAIGIAIFGLRMIHCQMIQISCRLFVNGGVKQLTAKTGLRLS